jgi:hypothetical protein
VEEEGIVRGRGIHLEVGEHDNRLLWECARDGQGRKVGGWTEVAYV